MIVRETVTPVSHSNDAVVGKRRQDQVQQHVMGISSETKRLN
jgi:hypothetical protein